MSLMADFAAVFLGENKADENEQKIMDIARQYHEECEAYDRKVCTGPIIDGAIMPLNKEQFRLVNLNAVETRKKLLDIAQAQGLDRLEVDRAINRWRG